MRPCWREAGLTERAAGIADWEVERMMAIVRQCEGDRGLVMAIVNEALFRVVDLPRRSAEFRARYYRQHNTSGGG